MPEGVAFRPRWWSTTTMLLARCVVVEKSLKRMEKGPSRGLGPEKSGVLLREQDCGDDRHPVSVLMADDEPGKLPGLRVPDEPDLHVALAHVEDEALAVILD